MPVEIKELVVRAVVQAPEQAGQQAGRRAEAPGPGGLSEEEKEALLESCVKEVLGVLRRSRER